MPLLDGREPARLESLAIRRQRRDLREGRKRGLWFDREAAEHAVNCFRHFVLWEGPAAGKTFLEALTPWQVENVLKPLFGWKRLPEGMTARQAARLEFRRRGRNGRWGSPRAEAGVLRRFRRFTFFVPRKNVKTTLGAGIGYYLGAMDLERGSQVLCAATKREQAAKLLRILKRIPGPKLRKRLDIKEHRIFRHDTETVWETMSAVARKEAGGNVQCGLADEVGDYVSAGLIHVLQTGMIGRLQPMLLEMSTAGETPAGAGWNVYEYGRKVLEGVLVDDSTFVMICAAEPSEDWEDPAVWARANPMLGQSVQEQTLRDFCLQAKNDPSFLAAFKRMHLNLWAGAAEAWIEPRLWAACAGSVEEFGAEALAGRRCYAGFDLSMTRDLTALVFLFPPTGADPFWRVVSKFYSPEETIRARSASDRVDYESWRRDGWLTATPGRVVDYAYLARDLAEADKIYDIKMVGYDPANAVTFVRDLSEAGWENRMQVIRQGPFTLNAPTKELERNVIERQIRHDGNPVMGWNVSNVVLNTDRNMNYIPDKKRAPERIDGVSALLCAYAALMSEEESGKIVYRRGRTLATG